MIDALADGLRAASAHSAAAYPLLALAGTASGIGPCTAPRALALVALTHRARHPHRVLAAFVAGVLGAYVLLAAVAGELAALAGASRWSYALLAVALAAAGITTLAAPCAPACTGSGHARHAAHGVSCGGVLLLGAASALVVSPCCAPAIAAIAGLTGMRGDGAALAGAFACGHALPLVAAGVAGSRVAPLLRRVATAQAPSIVAGTLMIALAAFYGILA